MKKIDNIIKKKKRLDEILKIDRRYMKKAYSFINKQLKEISVIHYARPIKINSLITFIVKRAVHFYGPIANTVFENWGLYNTYDICEIINNVMSLKNYKLKILYEEGSNDVVLKVLFEKNFVWNKEVDYE